MNITEKDGKLIIGLEGRIDTNNSQTVDKELTEALEAHPGLTPEFDASKLEYISSSGLRVLLKARQGSDESIAITDVSNDVYDIFDMTGFTDLFDVSKRLRRIDVEGCDLIGQGGYGSVYRIDEETIVKVYKSNIPKPMLDRERALAQKAFKLGIPTAISYDVVKCSDAYGIVFELINARTLAEIIAEDPDKVTSYAYRCANVLKEMHEVKVKPGELPDSRKKIIEWAESCKEYLTPEEVDLILDYLNNKVPDGNSFLHGDFHCKNIMESNGELILIDIGDATMGHPVFDLAQILFSQTIMPHTTAPERATSLLGFPPETAQKFWGVLASTYFGTQDPERIKEISMMLTPLSLCGLGYHAMRYAVNDPVVMERVLNNLVRGRILPALKDPPKIEF